MALQMNYLHYQTEVIMYNAYWRINPIDGLFGGKNKISYTIEVFKNSDKAHNENERPLERFSYDFIPDLNSKLNFIEQAYLHAKSLPKFSGSVDV